MKLHGVLSALAFCVLASAAVWMGGLNQDEGWYLYAAQLVGEGRKPYADFFYTQGPLMPILYSLISFSWESFGLLGARIATCLIGLSGILCFASLASLLAPEGRRRTAFVAVFLLLGCNLYHVYYVSIPKTYAIAALFVALGFLLVVRALTAGSPRARAVLLASGGFSLAMAAGARISLGALLAVVGFALLFAFRRFRWSFLWFGIGGMAGLAAVYGPFVCDLVSFRGLCAAQTYHAMRGGFSLVFVVGSLSRLIRWYLPLFIVLGLALFLLRTPSEEDAVAVVRRFAVRLVVMGFSAVFAVQMLAPFPYEDYQVPVMGLLAVAGVVVVMSFRQSGGSPIPERTFMLLTLGLSFASSFGSPLLEKWMVNGQDRFWPLKKDKSELAQLREVADRIEKLDPGGKTLLTQDLYIAIETGRRVPDGLEMGPFSVLSDSEWRTLLSSASCPVAALSGYSFAVNPPVCDERPLADQMAYWRILQNRYDRVLVVPEFGQNATTLMLLRRKKEASTTQEEEPGK